MARTFEEKVADFLVALKTLHGTSVLDVAVSGLAKSYPRDFVVFLDYVVVGFLDEIKAEKTKDLLQRVIASIKDRPLSLMPGAAEVQQLFNGAISPILREYKKLLKPASLPGRSSLRLKRGELDVYSGGVLDAHIRGFTGFFQDQRAEAFTGTLTHTDNKSELLDLAKEKYGAFFKTFARVSRYLYAVKCEDRFTRGISQLMSSSLDLYVELRLGISAWVREQYLHRCGGEFKRHIMQQCMDEIVADMLVVWRDLPHKLTEEQHYFLYKLRHVLDRLEQDEKQVVGKTDFFPQFYRRFFVALLRSQQLSFEKNFTLARSQLVEQYRQRCGQVDCQSAAIAESASEHRGIAVLEPVPVAMPEEDQSKAVQADLLTVFNAVKTNIQLLLIVRSVFAKIINWVLNLLPWVVRKPKVILTDRIDLVRRSQAVFDGVSKSQEIKPADKKRVLVSELRSCVLDARSPVRERGVLGVSKHGDRVLALSRLLPVVAA
jgi:hypothetical protein